jgi:glycosyltransferase involved in cell wall biosynthesis
MAERKKIAIIYSYNEGWIGGTYYIQSLIQSLLLLDDARKPNLVILCDSDREFAQIAQTGYPYLEKWENSRCNFEGDLTLLDRVINKLTRLAMNKNVIQKPAVLHYPGGIDAVFPVPPEFRKFKEAKVSLFWIPDFQEIHFPQFFDKRELAIRKAMADYIAHSAAPIVFSSHDAESDFLRLYPNNSCQRFVVPFAVTHPDFRAVSIQNVFNRYGISAPYFFAPNQFWRHKNQLTLIKATEHLLFQHPEVSFQLIFSGKEDDYRNPEYTNFLKNYVTEHRLSRSIKFLGFIDRKEQLAIMQHALAVVQPSLCEGWSTVVEDAKAMNQRIIASDLPVHLEQLSGYNAKKIFKRLEIKDLASKLLDMYVHPIAKETKDYMINKLYFAEQFVYTIESILSE